MPLGACSSLWRFWGCDNPPGFNLFPEARLLLVHRSLIPATMGGHHASSQPVAAFAVGSCVRHFICLRSWAEPIGFRLRRENFRDPREQTCNVGIMTERVGRSQPPLLAAASRCLAIDHAINGIEEAAHENESSLALRPSRQRDPRQLDRLIVVAGRPRQRSLGRCSRCTHVRMLPSLALCRQHLDRY
jgi:hypothetical protein